MLLNFLFGFDDRSMEFLLFILIIDICVELEVIKVQMLNFCRLEFSSKCLMLLRYLICLFLLLFIL
jgi:hypothetical protein